MKYNLLLSLCLILAFISCDDEEKAIETVLEEVDRGAVLRTLSFNNGEFDISDLESLFSINIEEQDIEEGELLESVDIRLRFIDNTPENGDNSTGFQDLTSLVRGDFNNGPNGLPIITIEYSFAQMIAETGVAFSNISCKDQFRLDLTINLSDGRSFNLGNSSGTVVNTTGFFKSPFSYLINVVEPIDESLFVGEYDLSSIEDGFFGPTFQAQRVLVQKGHSNNVRNFVVAGFLSEILIEFSVVCDAAVITRYQRTGMGCTSDISDQVLLGPDTEPGRVDPDDDAVLELWYVEGFEGYNAFCNFSDFPAKIKLSKQ